MEGGEERSSDHVIIRQGTTDAHHRVRSWGDNKTGDEGLVGVGEASTLLLLAASGGK